MPKYTLANVLDAARGHAGDDQVAGGAVFTNAILQTHFAKAYRALFRTMQQLGNPYVERDIYYVLPANTTFLDPATAGITDLGEPKFLEERGGLTKVNVTGAVVSGSNVRITATAHGFSTGNLITLNGIAGLTGTEGVLWGITVIDANTFDLLGCIGSGTYTSGGVAVKSGEDFTDIVAVDRLDPIGSPSDKFRVYEWREDTFRFPPVTTERQLRITYLASGNPPTNTATTIGIDDALDFLATYTAGLALKSHGASDRARELIAEALGPRMEADGSGGMLAEFLRVSIRAMQRIPPENRRRLPFRDRSTPNVF